MDQLTAILNSLEINNSIWYQFAIICVMFVLAKFVFIKKLQEVIETREEKTTKLEGSADAKFEEVQALTDKYNEKIVVANRDAQEILNSGRDAIRKDQDALYKTEEKKFDALTDEERKKSEIEVQGYKDQIFKDKDALVQSLIERVTH